MNLEKLKEPLKPKDIDFRIQSISKKGWATILAYKDARVDMIRLDEAVGPLRWKREHTRDNKNCIVSIYDNETKQWISKEDTGNESQAEAQKGLASDSFKRACFNWGIGRELYDFPLILVQLNEDEYYMQGDKAKASFGLRLKEWKWALKSDDKTGEVIGLAAKDKNNQVRFNYGTFT